MLRPQETVQKLLLSTPAYFTGEYVSDGLVVTHAWGRAQNRRAPGSPLTKTFLVVAFETPEYEKQAGTIVPNYEPTGEYMCSMMAMLFGKRFDYHGAIEMTGRFGVPDLGSAEEVCLQTLPYHGQRERVDFPVGLQIGELKRLRALIEEDPVNLKLASALRTASLFYVRALRMVSTNAEVAYLHLITACERMAEAAPFEERTGLEAKVATALARIVAEMTDGAKIAKLFRGKMRQLRRRFSALLTTHLDDAFFERTEAAESWGALKRGSFPAAAAAAYDLRSRYVHTGASFGGWIEPRYHNEERQSGTPLVSDREMGKILHRAPTFVGLERITRLLLLTLAGQLGADLPAQPAPVTPET